MNSIEKTLLWQQSYVESGYNTATPSISSLDEYKIINLDSNNKQEQSTIQSQSVNDNDDNNDLILEKIPELMKLLNDEDLDVVSEASQLVNQISRNKISCLALVESNCLVYLINCLANNQSIETAKNVVATFYNISLIPQGINTIVTNSNALQTLVNLLNLQLENIVSYAITSIHNILLAKPEIKKNLIKIGCIQNLCNLLKVHKNPKFLAIVIDCLQLISHGNQESKTLLLQNGAPSLLIEILRSNNYPKLILQTMRLLKVLSVCPQNKKVLINYGGIQVLSAFLNTENGNELQNCLITIRNLSDAATKMNGLEGLIENLIKLVSSSNDGISIPAAGVLSNLTCNNENNKLAVLKSNGIPILLKVIETSYMKTDLIDPCICILRHITNKHQDACRAQEELKHYNGLNLITNLLTIKPYNWTLIKPILGVVRNFASNLNQIDFLKNFQIIEKIMQLLFDAYNEALYKQVVNDVNLFDIIDLSSNIVLSLMKDYNNQIHMKNINCISFFVQLLNTENEKIQEIGASLISGMVTNKECAYVIDQHPAVHLYLNKKLNSADNDNKNAIQIFYCIKEIRENNINLQIYN